MSSLKSTMITLTALFGIALLALTTDTAEGRPTWLAVLRRVQGCHLAGSTTSVGADSFDQFRWTIADWKADASDVAMASVTAIGSRRFATEDGAPPASPNDEDGETILAPVVLQASQQFKGAPVGGYVVARFGGTVPSCLGYRYVSEDEPLTGGVGSKGVAFLDEPPADWQTDPPTWFTHVQAKAAELSTDGSTYKPMLLANWYLIDQDQARSELFDDALDVAAVEQALR